MELTVTEERHKIVKAPSWRDVSYSLFGPPDKKKNQLVGGRYIVVFEVPSKRTHCSGNTIAFGVAIDSIRRLDEEKGTVAFKGSFPNRPEKFQGVFYPRQRRGGWMTVSNLKPNPRR